MFELLRFLPFIARNRQKRLVLATIVATKGSSYRKTGTQMIIAEDYRFVGQLSGGCVEKEVLRQCVYVFADQASRTFEYDGTYRMGCKGIITVLLEPLSKTFIEDWRQLLSESEALREGVRLLISKEAGKFAVAFEARGKQLHASTLASPESTREMIIPARRKLLVIGSEADAAVLCTTAHATGFEVVRAVHQHFLSDGMEPYTVLSGSQGDPDILQQIDRRTAIVLMTHSWSHDLIWLSHVLNHEVIYLGVMGPAQRKEELVEALISTYDISHPDLLDSIRGPIGLRISSRTAEEIAISVVAELIQVFAQDEKRSL